MTNPKRTLLANIISSVLTGGFVLIILIFIIYEPKKVMSFVGFPGLVAEKEVEREMPSLVQPVIVNEINSVAEHLVAKSEPTSEEYDFKKFAFRDKLEEKRLEEERKIAEIKRKAEEKRIAEEKRKAEEARKKAEAEKKRLAELEAKKKAEAAEQKRLEEIALKKKQEEEKKKKDEEARQQKLAEEKKEQQRQEEVKKKEAKAMADKKAAAAAAAKAKADADAKAKAEAAENDRIADAYLGNAGFVGALQQALYDNWSTGAEMIGYTATIVFYVDQQGNITKIDDAKSKYSGFQPFDDSVKAAVMRTKRIKMPDNKHAVNKLVKEGVAVTFDPKDYGFGNY